MSKPIHTPGPCVVGRNTGTKLPVLLQADGPVIAEITLWTSTGKSIPEMVNANARLLAAAYNAFDSAAKKLGVNAVLLAEGLQHGGLADLISALEQARGHIDGEIDVVDGDYGVPAPNKAMRLAQEID